MEGAEFVFVLMFVFVLRFVVTFSVSCFDVLFSGLVGFEILGGWLLGAFFDSQLFHKQVPCNLLGISEAQVILQEGWLLIVLYCSVLAQ